MNITSTVSPKYQVTIPKEIRKYFSFIKPHSKVVVQKTDDGIFIKEQKKLEDFFGILKPNKEVLEKTSKLDNAQLKKLTEEKKTNELKKKYS